MPHDNHPDKPKLVRIADIMHPKPVPVTRENESHASDLPEGGTKLFKVVKSRGKRILKVVRPIVRAIRPILPACRDAIWPHCSVCCKRLFFRSDKAAELQRLKPLGEYEAVYDRYSHVCESCWTKITTVPCSLCQASFDVFAFDNQINKLRQNLKAHSVKLAEVSSSASVPAVLRTASSLRVLPLLKGYPAAT